MKNRILKQGAVGLAVWLLWSGTAEVYGRDSIRVTRVVEPAVRWIDERNLELRFTSLRSMDLRSVHRYRIEPVYCENDTCVAAFPSLLYFTRKGERFFRRRQASEATAEPLDIHAVLVRNPRLKDSLYHYADTMRLGGGYREGSEVRFRYWLADCCCEYLLDSTCIAVVPLLRPERRVELPESEQPRQVEQVELYIHYPLDRAEIYPEYMDNEARLYELSVRAKEVLTHPARYKVNRIVIEGYASPEGSYAHNVDLSIWRAEAFAGYLTRLYGVPGEIIHTVGAAENWQGLYEAVLADRQVPYREAVLGLLYPEGALHVNPCKDELQRLHQGKPYSYLLRYIYPRLRKMTMKIYYIEENR